MPTSSRNSKRCSTPEAGPARAGRGLDLRARLGFPPFSRAYLVARARQAVRSAALPLLGTLLAFQLSSERLGRAASDLSAATSRSAAASPSFAALAARPPIRLAANTAAPAAATSASASGKAANRAPAMAKAPARPADTTLDVLLRSDILNRKTSSFAELLLRWQDRFGTRAVAPLIKLVSDHDLTDPDRFVALMGAAKLGGIEAAPVLLPFLKDKSWMIRSGTLRALRALANPKTAQDVLPLLNDPALVVRSEAVEAVLALHPDGAVEALISTIEHAHNYHGGKAQWVPQKALNALVALHAADIAPRLRPLLRHEQDPALQRLTVETLDALTGKPLKAGAPIAERIKAWDLALKGT